MNYANFHILLFSFILSLSKFQNHAGVLAFLSIFCDLSYPAEQWMHKPDFILLSAISNYTLDYQRNG